MTLVRLRCAFPLEVSVSFLTSSISRIIIIWLDFLNSQFRMLPIWASKQTVQETMPTCFKKPYPTTPVILDCTELFIEVPTSYRTQSATFSNYKHHNMAKGLVGIAPNGAVTLVSQLTSTRGLHHGRPGFELDDDLPEGVSLNIPPFPNGKPQLSLQEENKTRQIASCRESN